MKVKDLLNHMALWSDVEICIQVYQRDTAVPQRFTVDKYDMMDQSYGQYGDATVGSFGVRNGTMTIFAEKG